MTGKEKIIEITIEAIAAGGDGIAQHEGHPVYVPKTAAGDTVRAVITEKNAQGSYASLQEILESGPARMAPPCSFYTRCGSCSLQHISPEAYRHWKVERVQTTLAKNGITPEIFDPPHFIHAASRRRATFTARRTKAGLIFGYNQSRSHVIEDISRCIILAPALDEKLQALRKPLAALMNVGDVLDVLLQKVGSGFDMLLTGPLKNKDRLSYDQNEALSAIMNLGIARIAHRPKINSAPETLLNQGAVMKNFGMLSVAIPPGAFLQASDEGEDALVHAVLDYAGAAPGPSADLFCGAGTFSGYLAGRVPKLYAADSEGASLGALKTACRNAAHISVQKRDLFKNSLSVDELSAFSCVVFDPPRAGAMGQAQALAGSSVARVIAVSCNPATFARDAKILQEGGYALRRLRVIDQFVYSAHVEIVALFTRGSNS